MIVYLIKSSLCLLVLGVFYKLFLEKEKIHNLKRYFLIFSIMFAYTIPLITLTYEKVVYVNPEEVITPSDVVLAPEYTEVHEVIAEPVDYVSLILWSVYGIGVIVFGFRFIRNLYTLIKKVKSNEKLKESSHTNVLLGSPIIPHTFLKYIFVPKTEFLQKAIPEEVLFHEKAHVNQRHTLDILFVEVLQVIFWFNPLLFWIKKSIKLNHEFLADQTVLKHQFSIQHYVNLLVSYPSSPNQTALTSTINYSLTKKRLQMMTKEFSKKRVVLKLLAVLPTLLLCVLFFNNEIIAQEKNNWNYSKTTSTQDKEIEIRVKDEQIRVNGVSVTLDELASTIDSHTKDWKDDELTGFNFDVKIQNVNDEFLNKVNNAYRSTRLYKTNPDHDLIPPAPPVPPAPRVRRGEASDIPPPPARAPKAPKAPGKRTKSSAAVAPTSPSQSTSEEIEEVQMAREEAELARMETEQEAAMAMIEAEQALAEAKMVERESRRNAIAGVEEAEIRHARAAQQIEKAERARARARRQAEHAARKAERSRSQALRANGRSYARAQESQMRARESAERARAMAMEQSKRSREQTERVRTMARMESQVAREEAQLAMKLERERARSEAAMAREEAQLAMKMERSRMRMERENLGNEEDLKKLEKEMRKLEKETKKKIEKARKKQLEATKKLRETQQKAREKRMKALKKHKESLEKN